MSEIEHYEILVIGSGEAGKHLTWNLAQAGHRTAVVERKYIGGSCPNIAFRPSKNGDRRRKMVESGVQIHPDRFKATGAELIRGEAHFIGPKTVEVHLNDGDRRTV